MRRQLDDDNFGANTWTEDYQTIKDADSVIGALPALTNAGAAIPAANVKALQGSMQTIKALAYMYILLAHDTVGMAINSRVERSRAVGSHRLSALGMRGA